MPSLCTDEAELHGVFNAVRFVLATESGKSDSVIDTLRTVLVPHI